MRARRADRIRRRRLRRGDWLELLGLKLRSITAIRESAQKGRQTAFFSPYEFGILNGCERATVDRWLLWIVSKGYHIEQNENDQSQYIIGWGGG